MGDLLGVELARPGVWHLKSGKTEFTDQDLRDAADFFAASGGQSVPVALGHSDPRFTGDPAFGQVTNVRYVEDARGPVLLGDVVDMPDWLAASAPRNWPNRSIEGFRGFEYQGRRYGLVLSALAFLGATPPGVRDIRSLRDLQTALAASQAQFIAASAPTVEAEHTLTDGVCVTCAVLAAAVELDDFADLGPDEDLDPETAALLAVIEDMAAGDPVAASWSPDLHPRDERGRFISTYARLRGALENHIGGNHRGDPFAGFSREQLRRAARREGIDLPRGATREHIAEQLTNHLHDKGGVSRAADHARVGTHHAQGGDEIEVVRHPSGGSPPAGLGRKGRVTSVDGSQLFVDFTDGKSPRSAVLHSSNIRVTRTHQQLAAEDLNAYDRKAREHEARIREQRARFAARRLVNASVGHVFDNGVCITCEGA